MQMWLWCDLRDPRKACDRGLGTPAHQCRLVDRCPFVFDGHGACVGPAWHREDVHQTENGILFVSKIDDPAAHQLELKSRADELASDASARAMLLELQLMTGHVTFASGQDHRRVFVNRVVDLIRPLGVVENMIVQVGHQLQEDIQRLARVLWPDNEEGPATLALAWKGNGTCTVRFEMIDVYAALTIETQQRHAPDDWQPFTETFEIDLSGMTRGEQRVEEARARMLDRHAETSVRATQIRCPACNGRGSWDYDGNLVDSQGNRTGPVRQRRQFCSRCGGAGYL